MKAFKKTKVVAVFGIASTFAFILLSLLSPQFIEERVESVFLDFRFHIRNLLRPPAVPENILIVAIDEKSLERYGRWPWSRVRQAQLIDKVLKGRPAVLAVDIFYPEHESKKADAALAAVLKKAKGKVVLAAGFDLGQDQRGEPPDFLLDNAITDIKDQSRLSNPATKPVTVTRRKISIPALSANALLGHVYSPPDLDGKLRWEVLSLKYRDELYPSLSLMTAARAQDKDLKDIVLYAGRGISLGDTFIPSDSSGRMRINYLGEDGTFPYVSAAGVLSGAFNPSGFRDKIVFLGTSAISTFDFAVTPFSARMPGVEKNATIVENIIARRFIRSAPLSVTALIIIATGTLLSFLLPRLRAMPGIGLSFGIMAAFAALNQYLFGTRGLYINFFYPFANIFLITFFAGAYKYLTEERKAKELRMMFTHYVSPKIVDELVKDPSKLVLGGEERRLTVLFSDIRGFTTISESLQPQVLVKLMNDYLSPMTDIILKHGGTVDKYMGDAIMAFWGAPIWQEDHQFRACRAALEMLEKLAELRVEWEARGIPRLDIGVGISTGKLTVGNMGSTTRFDYTVMGDTVNLGSRLEGLNKEYGTHIIVPKYTYEDVKTEFILRELDRIRVKGKNIPIRIYELKATADADRSLREGVNLFESGLNAYMEKDWTRAEELFRKTMDVLPDDGPSKAFLERVKYLKEDGVPEGWDGVYVMKKK